MDVYILEQELSIHDKKRYNFIKMSVIYAGLKLTKIGLKRKSLTSLTTDQRIV